MFEILETTKEIKERQEERKENNILPEILIINNIKYKRLE